MDLRFECPKCGRSAAVENLEQAESLACSCGWRDRRSPGAIDDGRLHRCVVCGGDDLYIQKDFPERVGVAIVTLGFILATIAWAYHNWYATFGILVGFFLLDGALFYTCRNVAVCYRCLAQYRRLPADSSFHPFDLAINERYRQERFRKEEIRKSDAQA